MLDKIKVKKNPYIENTPSFETVAYKHSQRNSYPNHLFYIFTLLQLSLIVHYENTQLLIIFANKLLPCNANTKHVSLQ